MHFAFTVTEDTFDRIVKAFATLEYRTRGPIDSAMEGAAHHEHD